MSKFLVGLLKALSCSKIVFGLRWRVKPVRCKIDDVCESGWLQSDSLSCSLCHKPFVVDDWESLTRVSWSILSPSQTGSSIKRFTPLSRDLLLPPSYDSSTSTIIDDYTWFNRRLVCGTTIAGLTSIANLSSVGEGLRESQRYFEHHRSLLINAVRRNLVCQVCAGRTGTGPQPISI